jgi:hypothetical protein
MELINYGGGSPSVWRRWIQIVLYIKVVTNNLSYNPCCNLLLARIAKQI